MTLFETLSYFLTCLSALQDDGGFDAYGVDINPSIQQPPGICGCLAVAFSGILRQPRLMGGAVRIFLQIFGAILPDLLSHDADPAEVIQFALQYNSVFIQIVENQQP